MTGPDDSLPKIPHETTTLSNGLRLVLHVDPKLPVVHVNEWFHVGSKNERPGRTGFAHLFEHIMFEGSKNAPEKYLVYAERVGANLSEGGVNGTTSHDRTNYFITAPSGSLERLLWLESDRLATLSDALTQEKLDTQRDVVKNERRQGLENQPYGRAFQLISENLYPSGHPYSWPVIGSHADLTAATLEDVKEFFRTFYAPNNLSLTIAGDFDPEEARRLVTRYFGGIPPGPALSRPGRFVPALPGDRSVEVRDRVPQERVYVVWPAPPYFEKGDADLDLVALILTDGLSSRLSRILVYDRQLCTGVSAHNDSNEISGDFVVVATARPGASLSDVEGVIEGEIRRLGEEGPTPAELARAQAKHEFGFVTGLERIGGFGGKADLLNLYNTFLGSPDFCGEDVARHRRVGPEGVRATVARWLDAPRLKVRFHPEPSARADAAVLDRSREPALNRDRPFRAPQVRAGRLANGLEVLVVERDDLPKVSVGLAVRAGTVADPPGREGLAHLVARTIDSGTKARNALEIEDALGDLGTSISAGAYREFAMLSFEGLKRHLARTLQIAADVVANAVFPESEVARERRRLKDSLEQEARSPDALAARLRSMLIFGPDHPYGRPPRGRSSTVESLEPAEVARFHSAQWRPEGSALVFAGAVNLEEALRVAGEAFSGWRGSAPAETEIPEPRPVGLGKTFVVDRQDSAQTVIFQVLPAPGRKTPDYYALRLADAVWGGGFATRLNMNLREDKGYSYGVFSSVNLYRRFGFWAAGGGVQTDRTREAVGEFRTELADLAGNRPITESELAQAKANRVRGYAQQFESMGRVVGEIVGLWADGLPMSELQQEVEETERTPLADVVAAARRHAEPSAATLLLVGDLARIGPGLKELPLGDISILDAEGRPVGRL